MDIYETCCYVLHLFQAGYIVGIKIRRIMNECVARNHIAAILKSKI